MEYFSLFPSLYEINVRNLHAERCWIWFIRKSNHVYLHMFSYETQDILGILTFQSSAKPGSILTTHIFPSPTQRVRQELWKVMAYV